MMDMTDACYRIRPEDQFRPQDELTLCRGCDRLAWRLHGIPVARWCDDCAKRIAEESDRELVASGGGSLW